MRQFFLFTILFLYFGCIERVDLGVSEGPKRLVVEGLITDQEGPYRVLLTETAEYEKGDNKEVTGAIVRISDDIGNSTLLSEVNNGDYRSIDFKGEIGRTYTLSIETTQGKKYTSTPQLLKAVPEIDSIYYERKEKLEVNEYKSNIYTPGFEVFVEAKEPPSDGDYYRWQFKGIYEVNTQPWDHIKYDKYGNPVADPKDCCAVCWITENDRTFNVADDILINGNGIKKQPIIFIAFERKLLIKYKLEVTQSSLTKEAFNFYNNLNKQINNSGTLFDPLPARVKGNIINIENPKEIILGIFTASAVRTKVLTIERPQVPDYIAPFIFPDDCRVLDFSTAIKPLDW